MTRPEVIEAVRATCESIVVADGLELVDLRLHGSGRGRLLQVVVDKPDGPVSLDDITEISERISRALDLDDPIDGSYTLEVSSAGLERPLVKPADYRRFSGRQVRVSCTDYIEGSRNFEGTIRSSNDVTFVLEKASGEVVEIPFSAVSRTKLVVDWDAELKGLGSESDQQIAGGDI